MLDVEEALLDGTVQHRAVQVALAGRLVLAVRVGAEVEQRQRAVGGRRGTQFGERDRVVAADAERHGAGLVHRGEGGLHGIQAAVREADHHVSVAGVDHREALEHGHALGRVVGRVKGDGRLAHRTGAEPGARAHRKAGIERQPHDRHVDVVELSDVGQPNRNVLTPATRGERAPPSGPYPFITPPCGPYALPVYCRRPLTNLIILCSGPIECARAPTA